MPLNAEIPSAAISCKFDIGPIKEEIEATAKVKVINFTSGENSVKFA
jgi:hypothetical protein